jgi:hypothetical protein
MAAATSLLPHRWHALGVSRLMVNGRGYREFAAHRLLCDFLNVQSKIL